jgi:hypothetical protein
LLAVKNYEWLIAVEEVVICRLGYDRRMNGVVEKDCEGDIHSFLTLF